MTLGAFNFLQKRPMDVYATEEVQEALKRNFHIFSDHKYPGIPEINSIPYKIKVLRF